MYLCKRCGRTTVSGEKMERIVTETRNKVYMGITKRGHEFEAGRGWEIVKEIAVCIKCYKAHIKKLQEDEEK